MSLLVGLRVSSRSPPMLRTTRPTPRFDRSASTAGACLRASCAVLAAVGAARAAARCHLQPVLWRGQQLLVCSS